MARVERSFKEKLYFEPLTSSAASTHRPRADPCCEACTRVLHLTPTPWLLRRAGLQNIALLASFWYIVIGLQLPKDPLTVYEQAVDSSLEKLSWVFDVRPMSDLQKHISFFVILCFHYRVHYSCVSATHSPTHIISAVTRLEIEFFFLSFLSQWAFGC